MANTINPNDILEFTCFQTYDFQTVLNVFHYQWFGPAISSAGYSAELNALINSFKNLAWTAHRRALTVNTFNLDVIRAQKVGPNVGDRGYYVQQVINEAGSATPPGIPSDLQMCLSYSTNRSFKGASGGKHFTGLPLATLNGSTFGIGTQVAWAGVAADLASVMVGTIAGNVATPVVWSPRPARRMTPGQILSIRVRPEARTQHSRTVGRGI